MFQSWKTMLGWDKPTSVADAFVGTFIGILLTYCSFYAGDILAGEHVIDLSLIAALLWLGVPVVVFGFWHARRKA